MILILECGSTKSDWSLLRHPGEKISFSDSGINPSTLTAEEVDRYIQRGFKKLEDPANIAKIYHYGAGVSGVKQQELLRDIYHSYFPNAELYLEGDMQAAVRATVGDNKGIVCILGTGSNSCYFDGQSIKANYQGFGYLIGDEGGGVDIGTRLIKLYYSDSLPKEIARELDEELSDRSVFVKKLYSHNKPNRYLASFTPIAARHQNHPVVKAEIQGSFEALIKNYLSKYPEIDKLPINFVGSISEHFREILIESLEYQGLMAGKFVTRPMIELEKYHYKELQYEQ